MKKILLILTGILFLFQVISARTLEINQGEGYEINVISSDDNSTILEFNVNSVEINEQIINGEIFDNIIIQEAYHRVLGYPEIPTLRRSIIIPDRGKVVVEIVESYYKDFSALHRIIPSRGNIQRNQDPNTIPYSFEGYDQDIFYPENLVNNFTPYILRDYRGVNIEVNPFQYNPITGVLRVWERVIVKVSVENISGENEILRSSYPQKVIEDFNNIYESIFLNYTTGRYTPITEPGRMIIITYDNFNSLVQPLLEWKLQKGTPCELVNISSIGASVSAIKTYIETEFNSSEGLTYVLLVGDVAQIPTPAGDFYPYANSDTKYTLIAGSDLYADLFISRFSGSVNSEIETQVAKSLHYDKDIQNYGTGVDWLEKGTGIGGDDQGGTPYPDWQRVEWLRDSLMTIAGYTEVDQIYHGSATTSQVTTALNLGRGIVNYIGHGSGTSWSTTGFDVSDVHALNNPWMLPFIEDVACKNGNYGLSECFGEAWLRAGDATNPDGAIAYHGASTNASWIPPCDMQLEFIHLLIRKEKMSFGGLFFSGEMKVLDLYPGINGEGHKIIDQYNILGDCELSARSDIPEVLTVNHNGVLLLGNSTYTVTVVGVENARCALYADDTIYGIGYTDGSGNVTINLDYSVNSPKNLLLTITGLNLQTFIDTVSAIPATGAYISYISIADTIGGHNNGEINSACTYDIKIKSSNVGSVNTNNVYAIISSSDGNITINQDSLFFGNINAGDTLISSNYAQIITGSNILDNYSIPINIEYHDENDSIWAGSFSITVNAPDISTIGRYGPQELLAGDTFTLGSELYNDGSGTGYTIDMYLRTNDANISINDSIESISSITPFDTVLKRGAFFITISGSTPDPHFAEMYMTVDMEAGYSYIDTFNIGIGTMIFTEDFEDKDTADWTYSGPSCWHITQRSSHSTSHAMFSGNESGSYNNGITNARAISPQFTVGSGVDISFWHKYEIEKGYNDYDGAQLQLSTDGGSSWTTITTDQGYTGNSGGYGGYSNGDPIWTGDHNSWEEQTYTFTYSGDVKLAWRFGTDGSVAYEGYYVDDINAGTATGLGVEEEEVGTPQIPVYEFALNRAYPNPVRGKAMIAYSIGTESPVRLIVYDISGREVNTLVNQTQSAGRYRVEWDGRDNRGSLVSSGTYFYRLEAGTFSDGSKLVVVR